MSELGVGVKEEQEGEQGETIGMTELTCDAPD
jgi:hypothetical protein